MLSAVIRPLLVFLGLSPPVPLLNLLIPSPQTAPVECVTDLVVKACDDFDCHIPGYHRIDAFMNQSDNTTQWNYVFYKTEDSDRTQCVTDIKVVAEGSSRPSGAEWSQCGTSAHYGVTEGGGPTIHLQHSPSSQDAGEVVDLVILRPGKNASKSEDFHHEPVNLGLGTAAGSAEHPDFREFHSVSSGWLHLEYTKRGPRKPIGQVAIRHCAQDDKSYCGQDLLDAGWNRRDLNLTGQIAGESQIYLFTTDSSEDGSCVTDLKVSHSNTDNTLPIRLNDGGEELFLEVIRGNQDGSEACLTSIIPVESSSSRSLPGYTVILDENGNPANLKATQNDATPIYIHYSTETESRRQTAINGHAALAFNYTGNFRIAHFSDVHMANTPGSCRDTPEAFKTKCTEEYTHTFMERVLDTTQPDLVIINGDLYSQGPRHGDNIEYPLLTQGAIIKSLLPIIDRGLLFATTWGNHDSEGDMLREELQRQLDRVPGYVGSRGRPDLDGIGNYVIDIAKSVEDREAAHRLWFFDSRTYRYHPQNGSNTGYNGGVHNNQVEWFSSTSNEDPKPGMAFFHIPLPQILNSKGSKRSSEVGVHEESGCSQGHPCSNAPNIAGSDSKFFDALVNSGTVKATFSGHDHNNDYAVIVDGLVMTYDGSAGYTTYSSKDPGYNRETRIIDLSDWGRSAVTYKFIDDLVEGTVHRNLSEPILSLF